MEKSLGFLKEALHLQEVDAKMYSPLVLAYVGDAVYEIMIRTKVINDGNQQVKKLHKQSSELVKAGAQANLIMILQEELTEEELAVYKRGRNAKSATMAKNASMKDYRMATGFEALVGYLYLSEQFERLAFLIGRGLDKMGAFAQGEHIK